MARSKDNKIMVGTETSASATSASAIANRLMTRKSTVVFTARYADKTHQKPRVTLRRSRAVSRYTIAGHLEMNESQANVTYLPTYRMASQRPINMEHISFIMRNSVLAAVDDPMMAVYDSHRAIKCCKELTRDIRFRIKLLRYDRYRIVVMANILEKRFQATLWQMGFLWDIEADQWLSFQHDTKSFTITAVVLAIYWE